MATQMSIVPPGAAFDATRHLAPWASGHWGLVSRERLLAWGLTRHQVATMLRDGWLLPTRHRGTYRVGHAAPVPGQREALELAASSRRAALGGWSAAAWSGLCDAPPRVHLVDPDGRSRSDAHVLRAQAPLGHGEVVRVRGLRCTSVERTLLDLPAHAPRAVVRQALVGAMRRGFDPAPLHVRCRRRRGGRLLRSEVELLLPELAATLSELEERFLRLLRRHGLRLPTVNAQRGARVLDCLWDDVRLVVELDGRRWHEHRFQQDRDRDNELTLAGRRCLRFTWWDLVERPAHVVDQVRRALAAG